MALEPKVIQIRKGLELPIAGRPTGKPESSPRVHTIAVLGCDFPNSRTKVLVEAGAAVVRGQPVMQDRRDPRIIFTSPGAGLVEAVNRGERRSLESILIRLSDEELNASAVPEADYGPVPGDVAKASREELVALLLRAGLWPCFRMRPFSRVPSPDEQPHSIFVTAMDSHPLAADPRLAIDANQEWFLLGLGAIARLAAGKPVYLCRGEGAALPGEELEGVQPYVFKGPHPAGTAGLHIHLIDPVGPGRTVWHIHAEDVAGFGGLLATGKVPVERLVAVGGPGVLRPAVLRTRAGASIFELCSGNLRDGEQRVIAGSVLRGREARDSLAFMGRFERCVSVLPEDRKRRALGWLKAGTASFSVLPMFASSLLARKELPFSTSTNGAPRSIIPFASFECVWPFDIPVHLLLRALAMEDVEESRRLFCLELDEEDLGLCTMVDPGKNDYTVMLRKVLNRLDVKEGQDA